MKLRSPHLNAIASGLSGPISPQVVTTRNGIHGAIRQGTASSRSDVRIENRQKKYVGKYPISQIQVIQAGTYLKNDGTAEQTIGNDFVWEANLEITSPAMAQELFSLGSATPTIQANTKIPYVMTDIASGLYVAAGGSFFLRQAVSVADSAKFLPTSSQTAASSDSGFISPAVVSQVNTTGAMVDPGSGAAFGGPLATIIGIPAGPTPCVAIVGDSLADGSGDTVTTLGSLGFFSKGLELVGSYPVPYVKLTVGGDRLNLQGFDKAPSKRALWPYVTHIAFALGTNDIATSSDSLATLQTNLTALLTAAKATLGPYGKPLKTAAVTIAPRVTTSDSYATALGQTPVAGFTKGSTRDLYNLWIKSIVGQGLLDAVIDVNPYVEDQTIGNRFITNGSANYPTTDGVHYSAALHTLASTAVNNWALTLNV